ncbi:DUF2313 domain-containing protein [Bacillus tianshenii]|nr:DUF2313 domain-containing protein [Bacillus tianshenii]
MVAIKEQTWNELNTLTWDELGQYKWNDFRFALITVDSQLQTQGVNVESSNSIMVSYSEADVQGVNVEHSVIVMANETDMVVSVSISEHDYKQLMLKSLPTYYRKSRVIHNLLDTFTTEFRRLEFKENETFENFIVDTTFSAISRWERDLGIEPNTSKPLDFRREQVKAKLRATTGTVTKKMIQNIANAYVNGKVEVIENPSAFSFGIKFIGDKGIPDNVNDLEAIINEIKPAHLSFSFDFSYTTWAELGNKTWDDLAAHTWDELKTVNFDEGGQS